jgi:hypothetical protein
VFITTGPSTKLLAWGGLGVEGDCVCLLLQDLVQSCWRGGGGGMGGHVVRETTSRGLCGLGYPSRTSERWERDCGTVCVLCVCVYYCST